MSRQVGGKSIGLLGLSSPRNISCIGSIEYRLSGKTRLLRQNKENQHYLYALLDFRPRQEE